MKKDPEPVKTHTISKEASVAIEKLLTTGQFDAVVPEADIGLVVTAASAARRSLSVHPAIEGMQRIVVQGRQ